MSAANGEYPPVSGSVSCFEAFKVFRKHCPRRNEIFDHCYEHGGDRCSVLVGPLLAPSANAFTWCPRWEHRDCCKPNDTAHLRAAKENT
jgi:hypothetical protein